MSKLRVFTLVALLAAVLVTLSACCHPCCRSVGYWWKPCGNDCAPIGDPCDPCDPRG